MDQVEEAFATWQESRRLMNEMAKACGFYPVTNKLEYMQALAWVSRDGSGHKAKAKARVVANLAVTARRLRRHDGEKELESRTLEQTVVQRPPPAAAPPPNTSAHGATSQHGPRFKRTRFGAPHELKMVEEIGDAVDDSI